MNFWQKQGNGYACRLCVVFSGSLWLFCRNFFHLSLNHVILSAKAADETVRLSAIPDWVKGVTAAFLHAP